jgi:diguanylate cyclase (GGDEF)-like protein
MRLITRNDASLAVGLIAGTVVIFQRPLRSVWEAASDVQERFNVDLLPALTVLVSVFIFHEARKRQQARAESRAALAEAAQVRLYSAQLQRLMTFGQALANALDQPTLQRVLWRYLPEFAGERAFWVLARRQDSRRQDCWESLLPDTGGAGSSSDEDLELLANRALSPETLPDARLEGIVEGDSLCFPMIAGVPVGVLGIHQGANITGAQRKALGVAAGLMAIAVRNVQLFLETQEHNLRDGLTNCYSRSHGLEALDQELSRARRSREPLSILLFDIDRFKTINDELGHLRGDDLLRAVGAQLTRVLRNSDTRCRYGGDEFLIILPNTPLAGAQQAAEAVRQKIATLAIVADGKTIPITVSVGIAAVGPDDLGVAALIERADKALYQAKRDGRDRCSIGGAPGLSLTATGPDAISPPATGIERVVSA